MSKLLRYLLLLGIIFPGKDMFAQRLGFLPSKTKWQQLRHDSLRIIYPDGSEETARRVASLMLKFAAADPIEKKSRYKPIDVILQPQTNVSNGYVGLAPYVSEFFLQSNENPFELGSMPWADLLAIHEYRHVQQVNAVNTGISHIVKKIFGDLAFAGMYGLATSNWLREGDAVYAETKWTLQGRGRLNRFMLPFREKTKEAKPWSYYKLRNGSYRHYYPDHYPLGYMMVQYGNHVFGEATWDTIFRKAPRMKPIYDPFSGVVKKYYGKSNRNLYLDAVKYYGEQWNSSNGTDIVYPAIPLTEKNLKDAFFDMNYPDVDGDGSVYCSITTFDSTTAIYKINPDGHREKIVSVGQQLDACFDYSLERLVWTEIRLDPRWIRKDENVIVVYDVLLHKKKDIRPSKGYYMPSLDVSGNKIAALHTDVEGKYHLRILDAVSGDVLNELPNEDNLYLGYPSFSEDGQELIATARNHEGRMCLVRQNISSGEITQITHYSYTVLGRPVQAGPWIFLTCGFGDMDQVYAVDKAEGIFYQVSGGHSAHYDPTWDPVQESVVTTEYTNTGKKLVRVPGLPRQWRMTNLDDGIKYVPGAEERNLLAEPSTDTSFVVKKYSPWSNALNIHSWLVTADDPVWGIELRSDDIMSNTTIAAGYEYNRNNKVYGPYIDANLGMWFPVLDLGYRKLNQDATTIDGKHFRRINEEAYAGFTLPFVFTPGVYRQIANISVSGNKGSYRLSPMQEGTDNVGYNYIDYRLLLINSRLKAHRQPLPSWGQRFDISYAHNVSGHNVSQLYANLELALPSFKPSHYLILIGESLTQDLTESIQLGSRYAGARGFSLPDAEENYRFGVTYGFPLLYPDIGMGNILYVRRVRLQPFYDIAYTSDPETLSSTLSSTGAELLVDFEFGPITLGFRFVRLLSGFEGDPMRFELFIPPLRF
jgi:hypothetical protein